MPASGEAIDKRAVLQSTLAAIARTIALECPTVRIRIIDIELDCPVGAKNGLQFIDRATRHSEVIVRNGKAVAPFLRFKDRHSLQRRRSPARSLGIANTFALRLARGGTMEQLAWTTVPRNGSGQEKVRVRVEAAGLNFRDVLAVNGMLPVDAERGEAQQSLGLEFAGVVNETGRADSNFCKGQRVFGLMRGSLQREIWCDGNCVFETPSFLSDAEAACLPSAYLTAHYAFRKVAQVACGEWVLIHSGAGGLGLAAIHVARRAGARIIATAGSEDKRNYVTNIGADYALPSRSLDFSDSVLDITDGRGVDVVLNALPGDFIELGLESLAPFGRFLELGKRDVYADRSLGLKALRRNASFHVIDIAAMIDEMPARVSDLMSDVLAELKAGDLPPLPVTSFEAQQIDEAFHYFASGQHIGKIAVDLSSPDLQLFASEPQQLQCDPHGTYLISGGGSGVARSIARLLAGRSAGRILLASRTAQGVASCSRSDAVDCNPNIAAIALDVTDKDAVFAAVRDIEKSGYPLRGIIHAAVSYDDALLPDMTEDKVDSVVGPKVHGALNLTNAVIAAGSQLEFFVSFSSMAQVTGWPGQANYAAANAFLESMAHLQRRLDIPGQCVNWGVFSQSGQVSRNQRLQSYMQTSGWIGIDDASIRDRLLDIIASGETVVSVALADWDKIADNHKPLRDGGRITELIQSAHGQATDDASRFVGRLPKADRQDFLESVVREEVAAIVRVDPERISDCVTLDDAGIDSLSMFELRIRLERKAGCEIPLSQFVEIGTFDELTELIGDLLLDCDPESH